VIVGDDEAARRVAAVKPLRGEGEQREVAFDDLAEQLSRALVPETA
jgi:histidyl-tRNA synthetase